MLPEKLQDNACCGGGAKEFQTYLQEGLRFDVLGICDFGDGTRISRRWLFRMFVAKVAKSCTSMSHAFLNWLNTGGSY